MIFTAQVALTVIKPHSMPNTNDTEDRTQYLEELYKVMFPRVASYISRRGGSFDEAKDIFQEAVIIYYEKISGAGVYTVQNKGAYIMGIARHLWMKAIKDKTLTTNADKVATLADNKELQPTERILSFLSVAGKKCMEMLHAVYYDKRTMKHIADNFGFSSERSATVQKYKCLEKVREIVKEKSLVYEDFLG